jgi:hypothetical protein
MGRQLSDSGVAATGWFYARQGQPGPSGQQGPVAFRRLQALARKGWLTADDLVWHRDLADWMPAGEVPGLFATGRVLRMLQQVDGRLARLTSRRRRQGRNETPAAEQTKQPTSQPVTRRKNPARGQEPVRPEAITPKTPTSRTSPPSTTPPRTSPLDEPPTENLPLEETLHLIERTSARHLMALAGMLLAMLGGIFVLVRPTPLAWSLLALGVPLMLLCLLPELIAAARAAGMAVGRFLVVVVAEFHSAQRRSRAQQDAALREAALRRQGRAATPPDSKQAGGGKQNAEGTHSQNVVRNVERNLHAGTVTRYQHDSLQGIVMVHEPAIKLWSRPVAGVLSVVCPGLGHVYKRQYLGGLIWFGCVGAAYSATFLAGLVLHGLCLAAAASGANWSEATNRVHREA